MLSWNYIRRALPSILVSAKSVSVCSSMSLTQRNFHGENLPRPILSVSRLAFLRREFPVFLYDETAACGSCVMRCQTVRESFTSRLGEVSERSWRRRPTEERISAGKETTTNGLALFVGETRIIIKKKGKRYERMEDLLELDPRLWITVALLRDIVRRCAKF